MHSPCRAGICRVAGSRVATDNEMTSDHVAAKLLRVREEFATQIRCSWRFRYWAEADSGCSLATFSLMDSVFGKMPYSGMEVS